jgi:beta-glucanase (GH16 family)
VIDPTNWIAQNGAVNVNNELELKGSTPSADYMTHWWSRYPNEQRETSVHDAGTTLAAAYHIVRVEWFPDSVVWYIDGTQRAKHVQNAAPGPLQLVMNTAVFEAIPTAPRLFHSTTGSTTWESIVTPRILIEQIDIFVTASEVSPPLRQSCLHRPTWRS